MIRHPLILTGILAILLAGVLLLRKASWEGRFVMACGVIALVAFIRLHFYLLLLVAMSMFAFVAVALVWALMASAGVRVVREVKDEAMVGESVSAEYSAKGRSILPLFHTRIWDRIYRERGDGSIEEFVFEEPGYIGFLRISLREKAEGSMHFEPPVRGVMKLGPIAVEGGDPFGIFTFTKWLPLGEEVLVLPAWVRLNAMPSVPARLGAKEQEHLVPKEGHSHEFMGIRPWTNGDGLRGVHWPLTAKHDALIVRQFQRQVEEEMLIILDADRRADVGDGAENALEYLITLALSLANASYEMGRPWNLVIAGSETVTVSHASTEPLLQAQYALARLKADREQPIEELIDEIRRGYGHSACLLLTPRVDAAPAAALSRGDAKLGEGLRSILVRVDPDTFATTVGDGVKAMKRRREAAGTTSAAHAAVGPVAELTIIRGDELADLFVRHAFA